MMRKMNFNRLYILVLVLHQILCLTTYHRDDSIQWSDIGFGEEIELIFTLEDEEFEVRCFYDNPKNDPGYGKLFKNGTEVDGTQFKSFKEGSNFTFTKEHAKLGDSGSYTCQAEPDLQNKVTVIVFSLPNLEDAVYKAGEDVNFDCEVKMMPSLETRVRYIYYDSYHHAVHTYKVYWQFEGDNITVVQSLNSTEGNLTGSSILFSNTSLIIHNPGPSTVGEYRCVIVFFPGNYYDRYVFTSYPVRIKGLKGGGPIFKMDKYLVFAILFLRAQLVGFSLI